MGSREHRLHGVILLLFLSACNKSGWWKFESDVSQHWYIFEYTHASCWSEHMYVYVFDCEFHTKLCVWNSWQLTSCWFTFDSPWHFLRMQLCANGKSSTTPGATTDGGCANCGVGKYVRAAAPLVAGACIDCVAGKYGKALVVVNSVGVGFEAENAACSVMFIWLSLCLSHHMNHHGNVYL